MATKNAMARTKYGCAFNELNAWEKAGITRKFNAQTTRARAPATPAGITAKIGRVDENGVKECMLSPGQDVEKLLDNSGLSFDEYKESIVAQSTGNVVDLGDKVVADEIYQISPNIKSA